MKVSRLSTKGQVTIPKEIRKTLDIEPGDLIAYEAAFHAALSDTLDEWTTPEDEEAFRDL